MKTFILAAFITCIYLSSCATTNSSTSNTPASNDVTMLEGTWELNYITGPKIAFGGLYPDKKPTLTIDVANKRISGNTSCNSYSGALVAQNSTIDFNGPLAVTRMMCVNSALGETTYLEMLKRVNKFSITDGNTLNLISGDIALMRFIKK